MGQSSNKKTRQAGVCVYVCEFRGEGERERDGPLQGWKQEGWFQEEPWLKKPDDGVNSHAAGWATPAQGWGLPPNPQEPHLLLSWLPATGQVSAFSLPGA